MAEVERRISTDRGASLRTSRPAPGASVGDVLVWALAAYEGELTFATSLGAEDMVLLFELERALAHARTLHEDLAGPSVFFLDTGRLHEETYELLSVARARFRIPIDVYFPAADLVTDLVRRQGPHGFRESVSARKDCCNVRKVRQLDEALRGKKAWITGLRREQSPTRSDVPLFEEDASRGGLLKICPLYDWTESQVFEHARTHDVPLNALHDRGFRSIGCAPCTRATLPGEDVRAGRFYWETPDQKECGLHVNAEGKLVRKGA